jgi:ubiquitin-protein ligase
MDTIVRDYEDIRTHMTAGLYVIPDTRDIRVWHGCMIVRSGRYSGGIFRFIICFHPAYPANGTAFISSVHVENDSYPQCFHAISIGTAGAFPLCVFLDKPFHPLVDSVSGCLQLRAQFNLWPESRRISEVILFIKEMLSHDIVVSPSTEKPFNEFAARL